MRIASLSRGLLGALIVGSVLTACSAGTLDPPIVPPMSASEIEAQAKLDLLGHKEHFLGTFPDIEVPVVARIRFIDMKDWADTLADCLTEAGFPTTASGGGISSTPPTGQELAWGLAAYTCSAQYPVDPRQTRPPSDAQIAYLYDYYTMIAVPCLEEVGFTDIAEPPSKQTYISTYGTPGLWSPYEQSHSTAAQWEEAAVSCPQVPDEVYGDLSELG
jgi:hypothetical protein